ncbi:hypothetical protein L218DRAFT_1055006 [Marasmius fiardii PR-910]|nr:hypothetical protein L218DRAFT_1055006 [Marasmius fiardii PR-910]
MQYEWSAVLQYHMDYHSLQHREMAGGNYEGWGDPDIKLMAVHLVGWDRSSKRTSQPSSSTTSKSKRVPIKQQLCYAHNSGSCTTADCKRLHQCSRCKSKDHILKDCPKKEEDA